ncbi:flagellar basal body P-ring protein FlgI [Crenobacter sp. SG2305]|uniref:flagellar basal body P-ring protein FlgI n=1 Tax=Crenobacter oryzisoli TaxID=3056844 RepID=UPI0025AAAA80|nr:flagellar basal body P-ring protein FlgI [Crenobacter sp. SG2305]MDN0082261.1 flagellar basal body P-ring protein FlgI [Crenobacter sp. SG2305]
MKRFVFLALAAMSLSVPAFAERIKDIASFGGVRSNQLIGYGLVVGLDGSGDKQSSSPFTVQSMSNMLSQLGVQVPAGVRIDPKNAAAVMITSSLPAFARRGQSIDVTVSSMGDAKSLRGGTLLLSPLRGADGQVYAMAQGNVVIGGAGASAAGSKVQINQLNAGRIPNGATVEREVNSSLNEGPVVQLELTESDFTTANRAVQAINKNFGYDTARAIDGRMIEVRAPQDPSQRVSFLARLENIHVEPGEVSPLVIINARTGSVVMNKAVTIDPVAVAHGNLSVTINNTPQVSQPAPFSNGRTVVTNQADISVKQDQGKVVSLPRGANLNQVVNALNAVGATPADLVSVLQAMKAAGALRAELQII